MASLRHRFALLDVFGTAREAQRLGDHLGRVLDSPVTTFPLADLLGASGWNLTTDDQGGFHIHDYTDVEGSRVRDSLRLLETVAPALSGRLLYEDVRGWLLDYRFVPGAPELRRLGRREYDAEIQSLRASTV